MSLGASRNSRWFTLVYVTWMQVTEGKYYKLRPMYGGIRRVWIRRTSGVSRNMMSDIRDFSLYMDKSHPELGF